MKTRKKINRELIKLAKRVRRATNDHERNQAQGAYEALSWVLEHPLSPRVSEKLKPFRSTH